MIITAGKFKGQKIIAPDENVTRPTLSKVRMSIFNTLQTLTDFEGSSFLDMYAGSGIMGLEALSRGFSEIYAIEKNFKVAQIIKQNYKKFTPQPKLYIGDSLKIIEKIEKEFDVIYIDPPYFSGIYEKSLQAIKSKAKNIIILEHINNVELQGFEIIKQKKYGDKYITYLQIN